MTPAKCPVPDCKKDLLRIPTALKISAIVVTVLIALMSGLCAFNNSSIAQVKERCDMKSDNLEETAKRIERKADNIDASVREMSRQIIRLQTVIERNGGKNG